MADNQRATSEEVDELHGLTCRMLLKMLKAADEMKLVDHEGVVVMPPPALLAQSIKFLLANGIDRPASSTKKVDTLKEKMPDFDAMDNVVSMRKG